MPVAEDAKLNVDKPVNIFQKRAKQLVDEAKAFKPKDKIPRGDNQNKTQKASFRQVGRKLGKQALVGKALDRSDDQEDSDFKLFDFLDDFVDDKPQQSSKKLLPKKKAPVKGNVRGAYYLANKDRMDKAALALQKIKKTSLKKNQLKSCNPQQVRNPNTNRCVKRNSKKGKHIAQGTLPPKNMHMYLLEGLYVFQTAVVWKSVHLVEWYSLD